MELEMLSKTIKNIEYEKTYLNELCSFSSSCKNIVNSDAFKRLKKIHFLGAIDYLFQPNHVNKRHTRYKHSLGVAFLALEAFKYLELSQRDKKYILAAALLHDIGHAPLSHSLEPVFQKKFSINHRNATELILKGEAPIGKDIKRYLQNDGLDIDTIIALISGNTSASGHQLFSSKFNIDTLDGIIRTSSYISRKQIFPHAKAVLRASLRRNIEDKKKLDDFWHLKQEMYDHLIQGDQGIFADTMVKTIFSQSITSEDKDIFYIDEDSLKRRCPEITHALRRLVKTSHDMDIDDKIFKEGACYNKNFFSINEEYSHCNLNQESKRYQRKKEKRTFFIKKKYFEPNLTSSNNQQLCLTFGIANEG